MMNNYFHDVATGLLVASGFVLWLMMKQFDVADAHRGGGFFLDIYSSMTRLARFAFWWIIIAGVPRTYFYRDFEWAGAADTLQVSAIIVKHVFVLAFVGAGIYMWHGLNRKVRHVRQAVAVSSGPEDSGGAQ